MIELFLNILFFLLIFVFSFVQKDLLVELSTTYEISSLVHEVFHTFVNKLKKF